MREIDYEYIAEKISNISRIPIRVYEKQEQIYFNNTTSFPLDPALPYLESLLGIDKNISYYVTQFFQYFGIIHHESFSLIIGPCYQLPPSHGQVRDYMFLLGIKENYQQEYKHLISSITPMPLELFLHLLCLIYYYISGEKLQVSQVLLYDASVHVERPASPPSIEQEANSPMELLAENTHNTFHYEKKMLQYVTSGSVEELKKLFASSSPGQPGKTADNYLRQLKNIFITSVTLVSRAAIDGGMPYEEALSLSDLYIQHSEKHIHAGQILNLQQNMVLDYATQVHNLTMGHSYNQFMRSVTAYIHEHLTEGITASQIANDLYLSRSYLSTKFKQESGMTLNSFIQKQKIKKAQEYLRSTNRSILEISTYLGFSSQGYFQNVFKNVTGSTPKEYRDMSCIFLSDVLS